MAPRPATHDDIDVLGGVLGRAFADDPSAVPTGGAARPGIHHLDGVVGRRSHRELAGRQR